MLNEPSLGLAPLIVESLLEIIRRVNHNGVTVLLVEQNVRHALEIAKTAYVLENGRIVLHGPAAELADNAHIRRAYIGL
jgi:branched-chain amino acid transport system ATP-binding protein